MILRLPRKRWHCSQIQLSTFRLFKKYHFSSNPMPKVPVKPSVAPSKLPKMKLYSKRIQNQIFNHKKSMANINFVKQQLQKYQWKITNYGNLVEFSKITHQFIVRVVVKAGLPTRLTDDIPSEQELLAQQKRLKSNQKQSKKSQQKPKKSQKQSKKDPTQTKGNQQKNMQQNEEQQEQQISQQQQEFDPENYKPIYSKQMNIFATKKNSNKTIAFSIAAADQTYQAFRVFFVDKYQMISSESMKYQETNQYRGPDMQTVIQPIYHMIAPIMEEKIRVNFQSINFMVQYCAWRQQELNLQWLQNLKSFY